MKSSRNHASFFTSSQLTYHCVKYVRMSDCQLTGIVRHRPSNSDIGQVFAGLRGFLKLFDHLTSSSDEAYWQLKKDKYSCQHCTQLCDSWIIFQINLFESSEKLLLPSAESERLLSTSLTAHFDKDCDTLHFSYVISEMITIKGITQKDINLI